ncbi:hypothetical protein ACWGHM_00220 [Streptomyces sp. NPDC054904]
MATISFDHPAIDPRLFSAFGDGDVNPAVTSGVELVEVSLPVTGGIDHPHVGLPITIGVSAENDTMLVALSPDHFFTGIPCGVHDCRMPPSKGPKRARPAGLLRGKSRPVPPGYREIGLVG